MIRRIDKFEEILSITFLASMSAVIILQVFFRYCISYSLDWPEELGRYLFIASVYIGSSYAEQRDKHLSITILRTCGGAFFAKYLPVFSAIITAIFCGFMTVWGIRMTEFVYQTNQVAPAMQFPMWITYTVIPLGMGCMGIRALLKIFNKKSTKDDSIPEYL